MNLYKLGVTEERVAAPTNDDDEAYEAAGFVHNIPEGIWCEELSEPEATVYLTLEEVKYIIAHVGGLALAEKLDDAITQIAVQRVMLERAEVDRPLDAIDYPDEPEKSQLIKRAADHSRHQDENGDWGVSAT